MTTLNIQLKRAYQPAEPADGLRILVERLWPRGVSKAEARIDEWYKEIAPSTELRKWYGHQPERWPEFREKYMAELDQKPDVVAKLYEKCLGKTVTFVFASRDASHNSAVVLKSYMESYAKSR